MLALETLGWDESWDRAFEEHRKQRLAPGRVSVPHRRGYDVLTREGETRARIAGRLRHESSRAELPVVGDWVALTPEDAGARTIQAVLPRRTVFSRLAGGREQVVAANVDVVFVAASLAEELDRRLLERYLTLALESGARPVILLTKGDLAPDPDPVAQAAGEIGDEVPVHIVSARTGAGLDAVRSYLASGVTGALLGPSGVGKSTLVNALVGDESLLATAATGRDGAGRHTTTRRQLVLLPNGGLLVDNPGMRGVHLWLADEGLEEVFADVVELESRCRFSDCSHETEPGCAVRAALADGSLATDRWQRYRALRQELAELDARLAESGRSRARRRAPDTGAR